LRLKARIHRYIDPKMCASGHHHVVFALAPLGRRYVQQCKNCGRTWDVPQNRVP
jgi:hypothetical protein